MEGVYIKARSEEVVPEMRAAVERASRGLEVERFVNDLDREVSAEASEMIGGEHGAEARARRHQFRSVKDLLVPSVALPIKENFWHLMGRRVRALNLSTHQTREVLSWGASCRDELRKSRSTEPQSVAHTRKREAAAAFAPAAAGCRE